MKITENLIIESIKKFYSDNKDKININNDLSKILYSMLMSFYVDNIKYVLLDAPTGSGKTIIGFGLYFCINYIEQKINEEDVNEPIDKLGYFLTSSKILQEQIDNDLDKFNFRDNICVLKGRDNYKCLDNNLTFLNGSCIGLNKKEREKDFPLCVNKCPYLLARYEAEEKSCTVLNYHYFLTVFRPSKYQRNFNKRNITIADEAHLLPNIITNLFDFEFISYNINKINSLMIQIEHTFGNLDNPKKNSDSIIDDLKNVLNRCFKFFNNELTDLKEVKNYYDDLKQVKRLLENIKYKKIDAYEIFNKEILKLIENLEIQLESYDNIIELINIQKENPNRIHIESNIVDENNKFNIKVYKHSLQDLEISKNVRKNFIDKTENCLFMSATLGNMDEYAKIIGLKIGEYHCYRIDSTFDFTNSPIYLCNSGYLNYNNFNNNINKIISDTLKICETYHQNDKGIIHTSTNKISDLLKNYVLIPGRVLDKNRYLFYSNNSEKERCLELINNDENKKYVLVGSSLYEGIDLKDEKGRFNILLKVPYTGMTPYIKKKMELMPFWYERDVIEKITQAIGRTNRHKTDFSITYLLDTQFNKLTNKLPKIIQQRLKTKII